MLKNENYKTSLINNRRYLGNKYKLLPFIRDVVEKECKNVKVVADIFSGTGAVASAFKDKELITNDLMYSNYLSHLSWFGTQEFDEKKLINFIIDYNNLDVSEENYMTDNFSNTFFDFENCSKIGFIREDIEVKYSRKVINERERAILITSLLYSMDRIANTCGHYDAYMKNVEFSKKLELNVLLVEQNSGCNNNCFNVDANELVRDIKADLVYIDPPYNSRQYCDTYHLLENVALWQKPKVHGVARKMDRSKMKSAYSTKVAVEAFEDLIENINANYILFSYNNMATKGNQRSNAKISDNEIMKILSKKGEVKVFSESYKAFTTGKSDIKNNVERLFLCVCNKKKDNIQSPLNYTGGKYKLLPQIVPYFPKNINTFVDLFCGGCNVGINIDSKKVIFNDVNTKLIDLFNTFKNMDKEVVFELIEEIIEKYELSDTRKYGYDKYNCNSSNGLGSYNKEKFLKLRSDFNEYKHFDYYKSVMLYVVIVFCFNNQIRFNSKDEFNLPVGKRDFNKNMYKKLDDFIDRIKLLDCIFTNFSFTQFDISKLKKDDFVYIDPPYLITCASYNENGGWGEEQEIKLLQVLDELHKNEIRFALSNVLKSKGKEHKILIDWIEKNSDNYKVVSLDFNYSNSNYQTKDRTDNTEEVLIINY